MASGIPASDLLTYLRDLHPGCSHETLEGARWGALLTPRSPRAPAASRTTLRVMLCASFWIGQAALQAVLALQNRFPGRVQVVGVATDDALSPNARISLRKRAWALMPAAERFEVMATLADIALSAGVPVYTGEIKTPGFRRVLAAWRPDAIITCGFGQVLDTGIIGSAPYGAYNCHPTDLANGHGAGPSPWEDMAARNVTHTVWSVHQMTEVVDAGPVIAQTPPINVADAEGRLLPDARAFFYKVLPPIGWMVLKVLAALLQRRDAGCTEPLRQVEIGAGMPAALRQRLLQPVAPNWRDAPVPTPGREEFEALRAELAPRVKAAIAGS